MAVAEDLTRIGFTVTGSPPSTTVQVGREDVVVRVTEITGVKDGVHLRAELPTAVPGTAVPDLSGATISASGDTTLALDGSTLVGVRRLVAPTPGLLYDAIHELAKTIAAAARLIRDLAQYQANMPDQPEPAPEVVAFEYPTPPPAPAPAPAPAPPPPPGTTPPPGAFAPTHTVPAGGLPAWNTPDASQPAAATLDAGLAVQLAETNGGWGRIVCENTWSAWVDASRLQPR
jgi:hypothetical protein